MNNGKLFLSFFIFALVGLGQLNAQDEKPAEGEEVQREYPTGFIALNAGVGTATGHFADKIIGGALSGYATHLSMCGPFESSYFGLAGRFSYGTYSMTNQPFYTQQMDLNKRFGLDTAVKFKPSIKQNYTQMSFLVGMYGTLPMLADDRLSLDVRALFGPTIINRPALSIDSIGGTNYTTTYTQPAATSNAFIYDFGFGIRYHVLKSRKLCLMINFDYFTTKTNFELESFSKYTNDSDLLLEGLHTEKIKFSVSSYDITAGIGYVW